jgi:hypothetical protein
LGLSVRPLVETGWPGDDFTSMEGRGGLRLIMHGTWILRASSFDGWLTPA